MTLISASDTMRLSYSRASFVRNRKRFFNMRRPVITVIYLSCLLSAATAWACGDKLLFLSRIYRHHGTNGATVAVYARPHSLLENSSAAELSKPFHEEGYHLLVLNNDHDLALAIQSHAIDAVVADISDIAAIRDSSNTAGILLIPVIDKDDAGNAVSAKRFVAVIKAPAKAGKFLDALDRAFESKETHRDHTNVHPVNSALLSR